MTAARTEAPIIEGADWLSVINLQVIVAAGLTMPRPHHIQKETCMLPMSVTMAGVVGSP